MAIRPRGTIVGLAALASIACSAAPLSQGRTTSTDGPTASVCGATFDHTVVATIHVSRSTNSPAIDVAVFCDGSADRTLGTPGYNNTPNIMPKVFDPGSPDVAVFLTDLAAVGDVSAIPIVASCPKSISFGTTTTVSALGKTSGDLECMDSASAAQVALAKDCKSLAWGQ
jgi:hypothetical protein